MTREKLKAYLEKRNEEMLKSEYKYEKDWSVRKDTLYAFAAGYAPEMPIGIVYDIVREIIAKDLQSS